MLPSPTTTSNRLSVQHLLRAPDSTVTLAPVFTPEQVPSPVSNSPAVQLGGKSGNYIKDATSEESQHRGDKRQQPDARDEPVAKDVSPTTTGRPKRKPKAVAKNATATDMSNPGGNGGDWGYPPPNPHPYQSSYVGGNGESSRSGFGGRRGTIGSPGAMSVYSQTSQVGGKRRRGSGTDFGSVEPEEDGRGDARPLAITCAPCRTRKVKCDSRKPVCNNCSKTPTECFYPMKQKPGLRPGTGTDMAKRIGKLASSSPAEIQKI